MHQLDDSRTRRMSSEIHRVIDLHARRQFVGVADFGIGRLAAIKMLAGKGRAMPRQTRMVKYSGKMRRQDAQRRNRSRADRIVGINRQFCSDTRNLVHLERTAMRVEE